MNITISGKHVELGDALRSHVEETLTETAYKYFPKPIEANVVFSRERATYNVDIHVHLGRGLDVQVHGEAAEPYPAFDTAIDRLAKRLRRYKDRLNDHHRASPRDVGMVRAQQYVIQAEDEADEPEEDDGTAPDGQPVIVAETEASLETLSVNEAVMRLDLGNLPALMFRNRFIGGAVDIGNPLFTRLCLRFDLITPFEPFPDLMAFVVAQGPLFSG